MANKSDTISILLTFEKRLETFFNTKRKASRQIRVGSIAILKSLATHGITYRIYALTPVNKMACLNVNIAISWKLDVLSWRKNL